MIEPLGGYRMLQLICGAVVGAILVSGVASADSETRRVTVSGRCNRTVSPDRGAIIVIADFRDGDLKQASKLATGAYERARDAVKRLGLKDVEIQTVEYSMSEVREWEKERQVFKGYRARMGLRVATSQVDKLGEVIAIATREGLKEVGGLQSFLSEAQQLEEQVACLQEAAQNARVKAEKLAASLGARVGETLLVTESGGFQAPPQRMMVMEAAPGVGASSPPSIDAGQQTLSLAVEVVFSLK